MLHCVECYNLIVDSVNYTVRMWPEVGKVSIFVPC